MPEKDFYLLVILARRNWFFPLPDRYDQDWPAVERAVVWNEKSQSTCAKGRCDKITESGLRK